MSSPSSRRRAPRALAALAVLAVAGTAATAPAANASSDSWSCWLGAGSACSYDRHTLRSARMSNPDGRTGGAGASTTTSQNQIVGGYSWGNGWACRLLDANQILYPLVRNASSVTTTYYGASTYGSGAASC